MISARGPEQRLAKRACVIVAAIGLLLPASASADSTVTVGSGCTLAQAVLYADGTAESGCASSASTGTTTIEVPAGAYTLTSTLDVTANTVIDGAGASTTTISGGNAVQVFNNDSTLELEDLTVTDGLSSVKSGTCDGNSCGIGSPGGGIYNTGTLTIQDAVVSDSYAASGTAPAPPACEVTAGCPGLNAGAGGDGGGIYNNGTLRIDDSTISGNHAGAGGDGTNAVEGTPDTLEAGGAAGNGGDGGGIYNDVAGILTITNSIISGNAAGPGGDGGEIVDPNDQLDEFEEGGSGGAGGGISSANGLTIEGSLITANGAGGGGGVAGAGGSGGGIENGGGADASTITNVTFTADGAAAGAGQAHLSCRGTSGEGGAIGQVSGELDLKFVTLANDTAPAGACPSPGTYSGEVAVSGGGVSAQDSIFDETGSYASEPCTAGVSDGGGNVAYSQFNVSCPGTVENPNLGALASNGGPTQTMAPVFGSSAIGAVPAADCDGTTDQRGLARPQDGSCTAGAYQFAPPAISDVSATLTSSSTATVSATINPNLSSAATTVKVEWGSVSAAAQSIGAGDSPVSFSQDLTGLAAGTTYQVDVVATNGDGTTTSTPVALTTPKPTPRLLATISVKVAATRRYTTLKRLVISKLPAGATATIICKGHGCPFGRRTFKARNGSVNDTDAFKHHKLRPGTKLTIEITEPGYIGEMKVLTMRSRRSPSVTFSCLPHACS